MAWSGRAARFTFSGVRFRPALPEPDGHFAMHPALQHSIPKNWLDGVQLRGNHGKEVLFAVLCLIELHGLPLA